MNKEIKDDLTPIEIHNNIYFKRDDLYQIMSVNGGKLRQCYYLIKSIKDQYDGVIGCCSIYSPQAPITATISKYFGLKCIICYGATNQERLNSLPMPKLAKENNAELRIISKSGIHKILYNKAKKIAEKENLFVVDYGFNIIDYPNIMYNAVSNQVENIPNELDNLVITCGSGITTIGVMLGIKKFNKKVKKMYLVATAPSRKNLIDKVMAENDIHIDYEIIDLFHQKGFKYEKGLRQSCDGIVFHPNYEAKTYDWLIHNLDYKNEKTLMWIVGGEPK